MHGFRAASAMSGPRNRTGGSATRTIVEVTCT